LLNKNIQAEIFIENENKFQRGISKKLLKNVNISLKKIFEATNIKCKNISLTSELFVNNLFDIIKKDYLVLSNKYLLGNYIIFFSLFLNNF
jgi:hypothetical protein